MMKMQQKTNHLKNKYASYIDGPIFFTAPHSKKLYRGGPEFKEKVRTHLRQLYTSHITAQLSKQTGKNSFMVWGKTSMINQQDLDPNYLLPHMFESNPFHQSLHHWALKHAQKPILHIDIHGKFDRKNNCEIQVGLVSMQVHWKGDHLHELIKQYFEKEMNQIFEGLKFGGYECKFNHDCNLHGYWGGDMCTMTEQAILLGIPSIQLEIPRKVRQKLLKDQVLMKKFGSGLKKLYQKIIVPWKSKSQRKLKIQKVIGEKFIPSIKDQKDYQECLEQIKNFEKKQELNLNAKFV